MHIIVKKMPRIAPWQRAIYSQIVLAKDKAGTKLIAARTANCDSYATVVITHDLTGSGLSLKGDSHRRNKR